MKRWPAVCVWAITLAMCVATALAQQAQDDKPADPDDDAYKLEASGSAFGDKDEEPPKPKPQTPKVPQPTLPKPARPTRPPIGPLRPIGPGIGRPDGGKLDPARPEIMGVRFVDRGAYIIDKKTGLLWQKDGAASGRKNFDQAAQYAADLVLGGLTDWRVPTREELAEIFPADKPPFMNSAYNPDPCCGGGKEFRSYWTSEMDIGSDRADYAFVYQWYNKGGANNCFASKNFVFVRCVHDPVPR
jgi:hypothetical protein